MKKQPQLFFLIVPFICMGTTAQVTITPKTNNMGNTLSPVLTDLEQLSQLNALFIRNFLQQDVETHSKIIHPDFVCIESNGAIISREVYLRNWATDFSNSGYDTFTYSDESIRVFGNMAFVRAKTMYTKNVNGKTETGYTIYTDSYLKENGQWKCVQVQITPVITGM